MPRRRELDGGWHHDERVGHEAIEDACQVLVDFGMLRAILPESLGPEDPVDPYKTDQDYWKSLWYYPIEGDVSKLE